MIGFGRRLALIREIDAETDNRRRDARRACRESIDQAQKLADALNPERVALRRAGIDTTLPHTFDDAMAELVGLVCDLKVAAGEIPIERGLLPVRRRA